MIGTQENGLSTTIAVIGIAGRFPGARDINEFWELLCNGREAISRFQASELEEIPELASHPQYVPAMAILEDIELFDAEFFGMTRREAQIQNPQHRLFLECCWEALETAGHAPDRTELSIGVFAGASLNNYGESLSSSNPLSESIDAFQAALLNDRDHLPTYVSYKLNLRGPSLNLQTACSTSLVAIHCACQSLLGWECDMALAGGASVRLPQKQGYVYHPGGIQSPDGHCRPFDARAEGTVSGNGVGVVLLKRLEDALRDGDTILALVQGSAINNDGHNKVGYTAPSVTGQAEAIKLAQGLAGVDPAAITYLEAHGTATPVGDPIEIAALTQAFGITTGTRGFCGIGSVKSNIGHLDAASGVAGFIKTVLSLQGKKIPPSLHFKSPNPRIDFGKSPFYVVDRLSDWKSEGPRRAGVSSFGIGGTNAHVVLQEAPEAKIDPSRKPAHLIVVSARSTTALRSSINRLAGHLRKKCSAQIADLAYTLQVGRSEFPCRTAVVCSDAQDAVSKLERAILPQTLRLESNDRRSSSAFLFPGQGSQYARMGWQIYQLEPVFREQFDTCVNLLKPELGLDLKQILFSDDCNMDLQETWLTQPALFAVEHSMARLWMDRGIQPEAMLGHSIGEYVAASLAGVFPLETALKIVACRGRLIASLPRGAMCMVTSAPSIVEPLLEDDDLSIAAINSPSLTVVSGPFAAIEAFERRAVAAGLTVRRLRTSHAFHSPMMEPILEQFGDFLSAQSLQIPRIPFLSNLTGDWIQPEQATDAQYWVQHLRNTVQFHQCMTELLKCSHHLLVEVGPGMSLSRLAIQHQGRTPGHTIVSSLGSPQDSEMEFVNLLKATGELWCGGAKVNWKNIYAGENRRRVPLPTYPFERERYWIESTGREAMPQRNANPVIESKARTRCNPSMEAVPCYQAAGKGAFRTVISAQLKLISQQLTILKTK